MSIKVIKIGMMTLPIIVRLIASFLINFTILNKTLQWFDNCQKKLRSALLIFSI